IPVKDDPAADADAMIKVRIDKEREAAAGHDGTRVTHPGLVQVAREVFDRLMPQPNQITRQLNDLEVTAEQLLALPEGGITAAGVESNIKAALHYLAAWLGGSGAVPINHLMEDAATAEIARSQLWQWIRYPKGVLEDGRQITFELVTEGVEKELEKILQEKGQATYDDGHYETAAKLLRDIIANDRFVEFLTLPAYQTLV
ncbi:MAG: malate synthase A, partial [Sedimenticola sp.]|nr:malate synthase A [Sedimenticola sp.]